MTKQVQVFPTPGTLARFRCRQPLEAKWFVAGDGRFRCDECYAHCSTTLADGFSDRFEQLDLFTADTGE